MIHLLKLMPGLRYQTSGKYLHLIFQIPPEFNNIAFMFDFDVIGDGSDESTFYFDDITQTNTSPITNDIYGCTYEQACNYNEQANMMMERVSLQN